MFKINIFLKFALIALFLIGGIILSATVGFWYAFPLLLAGLILLASYLMLGTIMSAADFIQLQDFDGAEKRLSLTATPKLLYVTNRAMYYIMMGSIAMNKKDNNAAEELFNKALELKLPSDDEKAMVLLQLANINAVKGKWNTAQQQLREIKKLKVKQGQIKEQVVMFEKAFNNRGQAKAAGTMGKAGQRMMGGGGKRRRPKSR